MFASDQQTLDAYVARLADRDPTLFADPQVAADRLGWIGLPAAAARSAQGLDEFARRARESDITDVVLLGMGGSSLAPLVFARVMGSGAGYPRLHVLDTTSPLEVAPLLDRLASAGTLVIVSSKSGTTVEPLSLAQILLAKMTRELGDDAGTHFVAITDPGSPLESFANEHGFARVFHAPADAGGRFAALTAFGTVPAALIGVDVEELASFAQAAEDACKQPGERNPASALAAWLADANRDGRDKLTLVCSDALAPLGLWVEQLVAESTGKRGAGILPVLEAAPGMPEAHGRDRLTFILRTSDDEALASLPDRLPEGEPVFESIVDDAYAIGAQFVLWEWSVALASALLGIEPFDQPDVEEAKVAARLIVGGEPAPAMPTITDDGLTIASTLPAAPADLREAVESLVDRAQPGSFLAVLAYLPENEDLLAPLREAVARFSAGTRIASMVELGPRYLHSTGQYHKGGPDNGLFLIVTANSDVDLAIPGAAFTLGGLNRAQAAGDAATLASRGRPVVAVELPGAEVAHVQRVAEAIESLS